MDELPPDKENLPASTDSEHDCKVCKHQKCQGIEERYARNWSLVALAKKYTIKLSHLEKHFNEPTLQDKFAYQRRIIVEDVCDHVIRACLPMLEGEPVGKGLYLRDLLDALKLKQSIKGEGKIEELWKSVEQISKEVGAEEFAEVKSSSDIMKEANRLADKLGLKETKDESLN